MEIKCDNCGAVYQLDEAGIPDQGIPVQCSACGSIFVARKTRTQPTVIQPMALDNRVETKPRYMLRRPDGKIYPFRDMATLQRWIIERKAFSLDEMSEDGANWTKLENISELDPFFAAVSALTQGSGTLRREAESSVEVESGYINEADTEIKSVEEKSPTEDYASPGGLHDAPTISADVMGAETMAAEVFNAPTRILNEEETPQTETQSTTFSNYQTTTIQTNGSMYEAKSAAMDKDIWAEYEKAKGGKKSAVIVFILIGLAIAAAVWYLASPKTFMFGVLSRVPEEIKTKVNSTAAALYAGDIALVEEPIKELTSLAQTAPKYAAIYQNLAIGYSLQTMIMYERAARIKKEVAEAQEKLLSMSDADPGKTAMENSVKDRIKFANALAPRMQELHQKAKMAASEAAVLEPKDPSTYLVLAYVACAGMDYAAARNALAKANLKTVFQKAAAEFIKGAADINEGRADNVKDAIAALKAAANLEPKMFIANYYLALAYNMAGMKDEAVNALKALTLHSPKFVYARELLDALTAPPLPTGNAGAEQPQVKQNKPEVKPQDEGAAKEGGKADGGAQPPAGDDEGSAEALIKKSAKLRTNDRTKEAFAYAKKALSLKPDSVKAINEYGFCLLDMGKAAEAIKYFKDAHSRDGGNADAVLGIALSYEAQANVAEAVSWYKKFLEICPNCDDAKGAKYYIEQNSR